MKKVLFALLVFAAFGCNNEASKADAVPAADSTATAAAPKTGVVEFEGPEIDLMKKLVSSFEKGDFEAARSCYSDSARYYANVWMRDSTQAGIPIDEMIAFDKKFITENVEGFSMGKPIYEVVSTPNGAKFAHLWARVTGKNKKTGKMFDVPMFASFRVKDGKLAWEWNIHDSKKFE